jgi:hypothetical protein
VVTKVRERETGRLVALKRLRRPSPALSQRLRREARTLAALSHPGIVRLHDVLEVGDDVALVLELVDGPNLETWVRRRGALEPAEALSLGAELAEALGYAHGLGVVHRDVKPTNVILDPAGGPRLVDFGLALPLEGLESLTPTRAGPCGTFDFAAPEQWRDPHGVDARADVYGLGATLYRLLTGRSPRVIREARVPEVAREVVLRAVEEEPGDRHQTMSELAAELRRCLRRALEDASGVHTPLERVSRRLRRELEVARSRRASRRLVVAAAGLTALGALPAQFPRDLSARLDVGAPLAGELALLVDTLLAGASGERRLLGDAHAVLTAALAGLELGDEGRAALARLGRARAEPSRAAVSRRLARAIQQLVERGALGRDDAEALASSAGPAPRVLEEVLERLRARAYTCRGQAECAVHAARWRHALDDLQAALPEAGLAARLEREQLRVHLQASALEAGLVVPLE